MMRGLCQKEFASFQRLLPTTFDITLASVYYAAQKTQLLPTGLSPRDSELRVWTESDSSILGVCVHCLISLNLVFLALDSHPSNPEWARVLNLANVVFTLAFTGELVFKLGVLGIQGLIPNLKTI
jgi:hypothetical protein